VEVVVHASSSNEVEMKLPLKLNQLAIQNLETRETKETNELRKSIVQVRGLEQAYMHNRIHLWKVPLVGLSTKHDSCKTK
jgi:hypothetical protein